MFGGAREEARRALEEADGRLSSIRNGDPLLESIINERLMTLACRAELHRHAVDLGIRESTKAEKEIEELTRLHDSLVGEVDQLKLEASCLARDIKRIEKRSRDAVRERLRSRQLEAIQANRRQLLAAVGH